jgi:hypothetical protein
MHRARASRARRFDSGFLKVDFSSKAKSSNVRDFLVAKNTVGTAEVVRGFFWLVTKFLEWAIVHWLIFGTPRPPQNP